MGAGVCVSVGDAVAVLVLGGGSVLTVITIWAASRLFSTGGTVAAKGLDCAGWQPAASNIKSRKRLYRFISS